MADPQSARRQRLHELVLALLSQRELELLDEDGSGSVEIDELQVDVCCGCLAVCALSRSSGILGQCA